MERLTLISNHFTTDACLEKRQELEDKKKEVLLEKYRGMSKIDHKILNKIHYGKFEQDLRNFEKILLDNPDVFVYFLKLFNQI